MKKPSMSDFEHGYAANVAPKYLTHRARPGLQSRLAGAMITNVNDSDGPSRRRSPEKRLSEPRDDEDAPPRAGPSGTTKAISPPAKVTISGPRAGKGKPPPRLSAGKEKAPQSRSTSIGPAPRPSNRRTSLAPGNRVTHLTKQFEKINKEVERNSRRYNVIRGGRRARPVATARARVQVLESVKDAIYDEPESSDSSEADSEDNNDADEDDDKETRVARAPRAPKVPIEPAPEGAEAEEVPAPTAPLTTPAAVPTTEVTEPDSQEITVPATSHNIAGETLTGMSVPPSPFMASLPGLRQPPPDLDLGERNSILRALSGFWGQQPFNRMSRLDLDGDDPMADPEHIFRDSSMVVRTDEPTSIIALALKYVLSNLRLINYL
jgi:1-phosphatidylinositol-3-phosphate 5-kinase